MKKLSRQEDHFHRLPDELTLSIFNKLGDLTSFFICSLVSKHFSSVVSRVRTVYVNVPSSGEHTVKSYKSRWESLLTGSDPKLLKLPVFLEKLRELESIYLVDTHLENRPNSSFPKWKVKFRGDVTEAESFVALLPASVHKKTTDDQEQASQQNPTVFSVSELNNFFRDCLALSHGRYLEWLCFVCKLVKNHTSLKMVTITDSEKQGRLVLRDEQLVKIRDSGPQELTRDKVRQRMVYAWVPVLHLPLSGYVMREVCLLVLSHKAKDLDEIVSWDFEDEEKILCEAIKEILKNHGSKIRGA